MKTDYIQMLCDISELNTLFTGTLNIDSFLEKIVKMVAEHMHGDVCSIYLYHEPASELILKATIGLSADSVNKVKLKIGEGLVGLALREMRPISERAGKENPHFKYFPETGEDRFQAFLAVPIVIGNQRIGVITIQRKEKYDFTGTDIIALQTTASQLAAMIQNAGVLLSLKNEAENRRLEAACDDIDDCSFIKGSAASEGFAFGKATIFHKKTVNDIMSRDLFQRDYTIDDFNRALKETEAQLEELQERVEEKLSDAASLIFASHLLMLKDSRFTGGMREMIEKDENPASAVVAIYNQYRELFWQSANFIVKEKVQDIEDLVLRILSNLTGQAIEPIQYKERIIIAKELFPSDLLKMSAENIKGIILVSGGITSHVAILARSLALPLVFAEHPTLLELPDNTEILIDAEIGNIYIYPSEEIINTFKEREKARKAILEEDSAIPYPYHLKDGTAISVMSNINLLSDLNSLSPETIDGIGLYRTEFPFLIRSDFPSEQEQYVIYRKLVTAMPSKTVTFRTLDIGGDKILPYYLDVKEQNPFLGMRSIRFSLTHIDIFKHQIRAILRAGADSELRIMFPMIASVEDFITSRDIVRECINELSNEGRDHNTKPAIGAMIELPAAILNIDDIARVADFFSIGTNDLVQYILAVDRTNEKVAHLYKPHHPAVIKSLKMIIEAAERHNIDASICGDMANNELYLPFLVGLGYRSFSVDAMYLPRVKRIISNIELDVAMELSGKLLEMYEISAIEDILGIGE